MGVKARLKKYIQEDRPLRLKSFVSSHDIDLDGVKLSHGQNVLHFCASYGSGDMLRCLLRLDCDAAVTDKDRNLPLHLALLRALGCEQVVEAEEVYSTVVKPLQQAHPLGQDIENRQGQTALDLLVHLKDKIKKGKRTLERKQIDAERLSQEEDERWRQKLEEESLFEYEDHLPRYSGKDDDFYSSSGTPSFDRWSEQIREEYSRKSQRQHQHHTFRRDKTKGKRNGSGASSNKQSNSSQEDEGAERLKKAREEMRKRFKALPSPEKSPSGLLLKKQRYERKFTQLLGNLSGKSLTFGCIPWPHMDLNVVASVLFCDIPDKSSEAYRKYLRSQQVRWHPDKFTQKFGEHLHCDHIPKIMARVKAISQLLNKLRE
ncbi:NF-kappa-B inhibitor-like protein 1 [Elysia marginata]|uniref:NF-kappa-B inhibitor-like protein 1 n=1 Tax=Elysia marginata TaxID=1093978 RepID=A0AAV4JPE9_9GAST|nr:NF-kappa-B inhibitor-like protein 1 [Elysia marginata]